ncbi:hypothetical protein MKZ38_000242 [Zalerion maritima]|uniref:HIT domain-containing protein n=1 Tax=Zalerion maritima TaxID=339359 RepID=A0AAD5RZM8_9PEZI|nr:hypothetical protein MKZ38_000242 [Zalerion maritima]
MNYPPVSDDLSRPNSCPFCAIAHVYPTYPPTEPPHPSSASINPEKTNPEAFIVLSTTFLIAFLDIMPLSRGHLLLCPRRHRQKLTDISPAEASEMGRYQRLLSKALCRATGVEDWNIVQNNGAAAAQVVDHAHFHLIPRPEIREQGRRADSFTMFGRGQREDLDEEEAMELAEEVRLALAEVMVEEGSMDTPKWKL